MRAQTCLLAHPLIRFDQNTVQKTTAGNERGRHGQEDRARRALPVSRLRRLLEADGRRRRSRAAQRESCWRASPISASMRLAVMDQAGIARAVLSLAGPGVQAERDAATAVRNARASQRFPGAAKSPKRPDRYSGFAHLPMQDARAAADELERCMRELKFCGAMINGHTNGQYLDHPSLYPFWERAQALGRADLPPSGRPGDTPRPCSPATRRCGAPPGNGASRPARTRCVWSSAASSTASRARKLDARPSRRDPAVPAVALRQPRQASTASSSPSRRRSTSRRTSW